MRPQRATPDLVIARVAGRQHGVVSIDQLRMAGLGKDGVKRRLQAGRLHRIHRGVYAVGYVSLSQESRWMAATLALGEGAALSHRSAASLWGLLPIHAASSVDVSVPTNTGKRRRAGIRVHRCRALRPAHVTRHRSIWVTNPSRTVSDLRKAVSPAELRRALRQAEVLGLTMESNGGRDGTRSELESRFLALCRRHRLSIPEVNVRVGSLIVDFVWPEERLVVETDGYRYHRGRIAFEEDRSRDLTLRNLGYDVIRLTYRQITNQPEEVVGVLRKGLQSRASARQASWTRR